MKKLFSFILFTFFIQDGTPLPKVQELRLAQMGIGSEGHRIDPRKASVDQSRLALDLLDQARRSPGRISKPNLLMPVPAGMSGARVMQEQGIDGRGVKVAIFEKEQDDPRLKPIGSEVLTRHLKSRTLELGKLAQSHARGVISLLEQVAPQCEVLLGTAGAEGVSFPDEINDTSIVNMSFGYDSKDFQSPEEEVRIYERVGVVLKTLISAGCPKLLVKAAGNEGHDLSVPYRERGALPGVTTWIKDQDLGKFTILVGNLAPNYGVDKESNFPGKNVEIQNSFICTLGSGWVWDGYKPTSAYNPHTGKFDKEGPPMVEMKKVSGTSAAAPIVAGAAALLLQKYPDLNPEQLKMILMWSADRTFVIPSKDQKPESKDIFVIDPDDFENEEQKNTYIKSIDDAWKKQKKAVEIRAFDPPLYGMGVLNIPNAFMLAAAGQIYSFEKPKELRKKMKEMIRQQQKHSASTLQKAYRKELKKRSS